MEPVSCEWYIFRNIEAWDHGGLTISHPKANGCSKRSSVVEPNDRLLFWGFSGEQTAWCSYYDCDVDKINLKELRIVESIKTALPLQSEFNKNVQNFTVANEHYLAAGYSGHEGAFVQYYDIEKGEGFEVLQFAKTAGWVNQCWIHSHWLIVAAALRGWSIFSTHLFSINLKNKNFSSLEITQDIIKHTALLSDQRLAVTSNTFRLIDLCTGNELEQKIPNKVTVFGSFHDSVWAIDHIHHSLLRLDPKSLSKLGHSQEFHGYIGMREVEHLRNADLFIVIQGIPGYLKRGTDTLKFKAVRLKPDCDHVETLAESKWFAVPDAKRTFCDMKRGRFAYMNPDNLQLVIMDFGLW